MNQTINAFEESKNNSINILENIREFLIQGEEIGIKVGVNFREKIENYLIDIKNEKLKVALIGGFSEGKTAIAAAWLERFDKSNMKISHAESTSEINIFDVDEKIQIIDTPGLFGFKEKYGDDGLVNKYKDITKNYVSSAHLIIYVMNSTNPIKESQKEDLKWLFRTLNLLPRTIFVLSRFDEVADIEDDEDYQRNFDIKKSNVIERLSEILKLSENEINELSIVAVAANPFELGIEYWLQNPDKFRKLSRINILQKATTERINQYQGFHYIFLDVQKSIVSDLISKTLPSINEGFERIEKEKKSLSDINKINNEKLNDMRERILSARASLLEFVSTYYADIIIQAKSCGLSTFESFFQRELGDDGIVLHTKLQAAFERRLGPIEMESERLMVSVNNDFGFFNSAIASFGKKGLISVINSNLINNKTILATRDGIVSASKIVGLDISSYLKFKPYGATNLAKGLNGALAFIGLALEAWESYEQAKKEEEFKNAIDNLVKNLEEQRSKLIYLLKSNEFIETYCINFKLLQQTITEINNKLEEYETMYKKFLSWSELGKKIQEQLERSSKNLSTSPFSKNSMSF